MDLHLIVDNYSTHKHPKVKRWQKRHPRFHMHFIPTSSSWLNMIERWFREITDKRIRRGLYKRAATESPHRRMWSASTTDVPKPFNLDQLRYSGYSGKSPPRPRGAG